HIYENKIVWYDDRDSNSGTDIYMYDITTGKETKIGGTMGNDHSPRIHGDRIIWNVYNDKTRDYDLYLYEISTGRQNQITKGQNMEVMADIYGDKIVWVTQYEDRTNEFPVYLYDINTKTQSRITSHSSTNFFPKINGNRVVWMDYRSYSNSNPDIYMYDITTGKETQITTNRLSQGTPAIHDNKIVWEDNRNGNYDIYMATLSDAATGKCIPVSESSTSGQGTLVLAITDDIVEGIRELWVTLSNVEVHKDNQWVSFAPEQKTFELLSLADAAAIIGSKQLAPGKYTQIRFQVVNANLILEDGTAASVKIPSGEIKLVQEFTVEEGKTTYLYIDFKPESVLKAGSQYILQPVIKLRTKDEFKGDLCENKNKCNDRNPCTTDSCSESFCSYEVLPDGTGCGNKKICMSGNCVPEKNCKGGKCNVPDNWDPCAKINFNTTGYKISPPSPGYLYNFVFADLDGDGDKDLAAGGLDKKLLDEAIKIWRESGYSSDALNVSANVVRVYFNDGKGNFAYSGQYIGVPYIYPDVGDIDGDGDKDIVTGSTSWFKNAYNIYFNDGKGFFTPSSQRVGGYSNYQPKLADLDKDGDLDLYFASSISHLLTTGRIFLNDGKGYFTEKSDTGLTAGNTYGAALFDSDKDGDTDLVEFGYIRDLTSGYYLNLTEKIYKNDGTGKFTLTQTIIDTAFAGGIASADVDNDGDIDFVAANGVFKNDGNGFFNRVSPEYGGSTYFESPFGDADKDGDVDITAGHSIGANDGTGSFYGYCNWLEIGLYSIDAKFADVDGDGDLDAATTSNDYVYNYTTGYYKITGSSLYIFPNLINKR
ncbi:VCBS repeat-containing protein, partial [Candidatus Woesearchaeota archaeon]|nr:VCBS repeat-containing protein [Candidatus Woesearchaeota archaeon]